jgi:hypothetical protein
MGRRLKDDDGREDNEVEMGRLGNDLWELKLVRIRTKS